VNWLTKFKVGMKLPPEYKLISLRMMTKPIHSNL